MTFLRIIIGALMLTLCSGCGEKTAPANSSLYSFEKGYMGTTFTIRAWADESEEENLKSAADAAFAEIGRLEMIFSDYQLESEITKLADAKAGEATPISDEMTEVISKSLALSRETDGAFDITVAPMIRLWRMSRKNGRLPTESMRETARERSGFEKLKLDENGKTITFLVENMRLDFGGIVKGYSADRALEILKNAGFSSSLVAASGDIAVGDPPPGKDGWRVRLETLGSEASGTVLLKNAAVSTSGDTRQFVELDGVRYSHIVDPQTGFGLTERIGVSAVAPHATITDSHATAVSILGAEKGLAFIESKPGVECVIVKGGEGSEVTRVESPGMAKFWVEAEMK